MRRIWRRVAAAGAAATAMTALTTGNAAATAGSARSADVARAPWGGPSATVILDPGLGRRVTAAARVFGYIDRRIGTELDLRVRPAADFLTGGAAADFVQTVRLGDPGAGHLAFTWRYTTPVGVVHSDTIVRPGLPATGPGSFTRVLAHEAEMSVGVGECSDARAVCYWTFGTSVPRLDATDRARLAEVRSYVESLRR